MNRTLSVICIAALAVLPGFCCTGCCVRRVAALRNETRDSLVIEKNVEYRERLRDTVIYITLPAESSEREAKTDTSFLQTSLAVSTAAILPDGSLGHSLRNKPGPVAAGVSLPEKHTVIVSMERSGNYSIAEIPVERSPGGMEKFLIGSGILFWGAVLCALAVLLFKLLR